VIIRNHIGEGGKSVLEYVPENDADRSEVERMWADEEIKDQPAQKDIDQTLETK
jgi:hypothetical protein